MHNCIINGMNSRSIELDLMRCLAIIFVIAGHFFSINIEFRTTPFYGEPSMVLQEILMLCLVFQ